MRVVLRDLWQRGITERQDLLPMSGGCLRVCKLFFKLVNVANRQPCKTSNFFKEHKFFSSYYLCSELCATTSPSK